MKNSAVKKILLLGGSAQQIVAIETAKRLGYYTVLCDYLPDNPGQHYADKFYLVSTTDKNAVLNVAKSESIDGVLAYASDPAAPTAAYVAEKMNLPTNPLLSVETLCNKDKFRQFLNENGFHTPRAKGYENFNSAFQELKSGYFNLPIIIKPVDSSGSKGITVLHSLENLEEAVDFAFSFSRSKRIVVEEFIEKNHEYLIGGDIFVIDGKVELWGLLNCHRDENVNKLVPIGKSYPLDISENDFSSVKQTLQEIVDKLSIKNGAMNVELVVDKNGYVFPIDIGPRNGGNMIPDLLGMIFGVDVVEMTVKVSMGEKLVDNDIFGNGLFATHNLHSNKCGIFECVEYSNEIRNYIVKENIYKKKGDKVEFFDNASKAIGIVFLQFENEQQMKGILKDINKHIVVCLGK